jgi:hypothetical protein
MGIVHQAVQCWAGVLRAGHAFIDILTSNRPSTAGGVLTQLGQLHFGVLAILR